MKGKEGGWQVEESVTYKGWGFKNEYKEHTTMLL
jgi:hypothetical protein